MHQIIKEYKELKDELKKDCLDELAPQIALLHEMYVNSNAALQKELQGKLDTLRGEMWSRWHIAAMWAALIISIIVGRI